MDHRERVWHAIHHQQPDRVPKDFSARPEVSDALMRHLGLSDYDALLEHFDVDLRYIKPSEVVFERERYRGPPLERYADGAWEDIWGVRRKQVRISTGVYDQVVYSPLAEACSVEAVAAHRWPDPDWFDYADVAKQCQRYRGYALAGGGWGAIFGDSFRLQGMETFMMNMTLCPEVVHAIVDRVERFYADVNERIFDAARGQLDIFYFGNDFGSQVGLLLGPKMFREFFAPGMARLARQAKEPGMAVMHHSCGAVRPLIDDFIACGVDILDPVQARAADMDPLSLKTEFGDRICLHGGIDTQNLLPFGTTQQVTERVRQVADVVGAGGGYILAPDQSLQGDIPFENILAMYSAT